jgi:hypothetical protein
MSEEFYKNIGEQSWERSGVRVVPATWPSAQNVLSVDTLLARWRFFLPSDELVGRILEMNDKLGSDYFEKLVETTSARENTDLSSEEEPIQSVLWYRWLFYQLSEVLFHRSDTDKRTSLSDEESGRLFQRFLSERIYNHLAMLSRTDYAKRGNAFSIKEELTEELAEKVGLGLYLSSDTNVELRDEIEKLLMEMAFAFQQWLVVDQQGTYTTTWGTICTPQKRDEFILEESESEPVVLTPDVQFQKSSSVIGRFFKKAARAR